MTEEKRVLIPVMFKNLDMPKKSRKRFSISLMFKL